MGTDDRPSFVGTYTFVLLLVALILLVISWVMSDYPVPDEFENVIPLVVGSHALMGALAALAGVLRLLRVPVARLATLAASVALILWIPTGTALFAWWLLDVRKREQPD